MCWRPLAQQACSGGHSPHERRQAAACLHSTPHTSTRTHECSSTRTLPAPCLVQSNPSALRTVLRPTHGCRPARAARRRYRAVQRPRARDRAPPRARQPPRPPWPGTGARARSARRACAPVHRMVAARAAAVWPVVSTCMLPALCSPGASVHSRGSARKHPRRRKPHGHTLTRSAPGGHTQQRGERHARQARVRAVLVGRRGRVGGRRAARRCRASVIPRAPCGLRAHTVMQRSLRMLHTRRSLPAGSRPSAHTASRPSRMSHTPACASGARCGAMHVAARRAARPAIDREQAQRTRERAPLTPRSRCIGRFLAVCMCTPTGIFARGRAAASVAAPSCARLLRPAQGQLLTCERVSPCGPACASQAC
jgi:hypothetical protein